MLKKIHFRENIFQKADAKALFGGDLSSTDDESKKSDKEEDRELTADDVIGPRLYSEPEGASIIYLTAFHLDSIPFPGKLC